MLMNLRLHNPLRGNTGLGYQWARIFQLQSRSFLSTESDANHTAVEPSSSQLMISNLSPVAGSHIRVYKFSFLIIKTQIILFHRKKELAEVADEAARVAVVMVGRSIMAKFPVRGLQGFTRIRL
jgi:hypothetical protein